MSKQTAEIKRQVKNAIIRGDTLPYSLRTLIEAGVGIDKIRLVLRNPELR
jgi:hypothetical protein